MADNENFRQDRRRAMSLLQEATRLIGEESESLNIEANQNAICQGEQHQRTENTERPLCNESRTSTSSTRCPSVSTINSVRERSLGNFTDLFDTYEY